MNTNGTLQEEQENRKYRIIQWYLCILTNITVVDK